MIPFRLVLRSFGFTLLILLLVGLAFTAGYLYHQHQTAALDFSLFNEAYQLIQTYGLKDLPPKPVLEYGLIRGLLQAYNEPHTTFLEPPQNELEGNRLAGKYGGIGAQVEQDAKKNWRLYPFPDSPAAQAGVREGDQLLKVDDLEIGPQTASEVLVAALRGPVDSQTTLSLVRPPNGPPFTVQVKRAEIPLPSVTWRLAPDEARLGVIKVNWMAATTAGEIQQAVEDLKTRGATHYALDLRDNPGGLVDSGVDIARLFLKDGEVMQQQYRGQEVKTYRVEKPGSLADIPLVILINHGSASAAEIAAGALQARQRALLVGQPSYGKDTVQLVFSLQDGSSMHITAAHWWIPGHAGSLAGVGLQPDIAVEAPPAQGSSPDSALQAVIQHWFGS